MPTYDYRCDKCGDFSQLRPIASRDVPAVCPGCGEVAPRALVAAPSLSGGAAEGTSSSHGGNCACCGPVKLAGRTGGSGWSAGR
ncbi:MULTISPECIES: zinc ribbon domain-containing protein [unclassified Cupriavidus]|uniref:FmdB family zinc ribbon protein n=1 Tax=unclassified Cupriavidus TaxID=2640874 RepID=UPI0010F86836|nr:MULTISPECIES: zinc ribbon domain-containing protein [unclassified Cupriavidus]MWL87405.1 zinc ribbon domain-containing protein [Cupriavidus sp. SW-Y-13]